MAGGYSWPTVVSCKSDSKQFRARQGVEFGGKKGRWGASVLSLARGYTMVAGIGTAQNIIMYWKKNRGSRRSSAHCQFRTRNMPALSPTHERSSYTSVSHPYTTRILAQYATMEGEGGEGCGKKMGDGKKKKRRKECVYLRTHSTNLLIVRRWKPLEIIFLSFPKK